LQFIGAGDTGHQDNLPTKAFAKQILKQLRTSIYCTQYQIALHAYKY